MIHLREHEKDVIRNAVSLGGDTDTIAAIAGAMAECFFGIPSALRDECFNKLEEDMQLVVKRFENEMRMVGM